MYQTCGCTPYNQCGKPINNDVCSGCGKKSVDCTCKKQTELINSSQKIVSKLRKYS